jgi:hypothetical protein
MRAAAARGGTRSVVQNTEYLARMECVHSRERPKQTLNRHYVSMRRRNVQCTLGSLSDSQILNLVSLTHFSQPSNYFADTVFIHTDAVSVLYLDGFKEAPSSQGRFEIQSLPDTSLAHISHLATRQASASPGPPSIHLVLTDAGKRSAYLATWMQRGMKVLTRPARTRSIARFVGLVRHSSRVAAAMALRFPVYPPARYAGESEPVKRPKVRIELG